MSEEQTGLTDPLADSAKAAVYFDTHRPAGDPEREAVMQEVTRYFEARYGTEEVDVKPFHGSSDEEDTLDAPEVEDVQATSTGGSDARHLTFNEYQSPLTAEFVQEMFPSIREDAVAAGFEAEGAVNWVDYAKSVGEHDGAAALQELIDLSEQYPGDSWRKDAALTRRIHALNLRVDKGTLRLWSRLGRG